MTTVHFTPILMNGQIHDQHLSQLNKTMTLYVLISKFPNILIRHSCVLRSVKL
jgi:hypothetical protein